MDRINDIQALEGGTFRVAVDGREVEVAPGEPVIAVLNAVGLQGFSRNNHGVRTGGYCWMGVCHSCTVKIWCAASRWQWTSGPIRRSASSRRAPRQSA